MSARPIVVLFQHHSTGEHFKMVYDGECVEQVVDAIEYAQACGYDCTASRAPPDTREPSHAQ